MSVSRPSAVQVGNQIRWRDGLHIIVGIFGGLVRLRDVVGQDVEVLVGTLLSDPTFQVVTGGDPRIPLAPAGLIDDLPEEAVTRARWWEEHIVEVLRGYGIDAEPEQEPRPEYDPHTTSLRQRELAKVAELAELGQPVALSTFQRLRHKYAARGL
ncbi:hypothetical protein [Nonomuraea longicatena]|uniref:Transposase n=1 Tax=Nonomuraea longicatena TaxID=83682 RepID=A0ABN1PNV0_9ACTN